MNIKKTYTVQEAFEVTLDALRELRVGGVEVILKPAKIRQETLEKYGNRFDRLNPSYWMNANLKGTKPEHSDLIYKAANDLAMKGICFDTGGTCDSKDWELDWSFTVNADNKGMIEGREVVKHIQDKLCSSENE